MMPTVRVSDDGRVILDPPDGLAYSMRPADAADLAADMFECAARAAIMWQRLHPSQQSEDPT